MIAGAACLASQNDWGVNSRLSNQDLERIVRNMFVLLKPMVEESGLSDAWHAAVEPYLAFYRQLQPGCADMVHWMPPASAMAPASAVAAAVRPDPTDDRDPTHDFTDDPDPLQDTGR